MDYYVWKGFCINCGNGIIESPNGKISKYVPGNLETVPKDWMKVRTINKKILQNGQIIELGLNDCVYVFVCSPKCSHEMEQFFAGGGVQYGTMSSESDKLTWEYGN